MGNHPDHHAPGHAGPDWLGAIDRARAHAPFLARSLDRLPDLTALLAAGEGDAALAWACDAGAGAADVGVALRRERLALALALAIGDLAGAFPLLTVTGALSDFADRAMDMAIRDAIARHLPNMALDADALAKPAGFIALALGKHGARELNYSSDIDPILLYDPATLPRRARDDPAEAAQRIARAVVATLAAVTDEGYVFRVDLRLRPASEVSPMALPIGAALTHYEGSALAWERAAFIRARACAGDVPAGDAFLAAIRPFVWRKSLDFGAIADIGRLTARIRSSAGARNVGPGFDIKKGRGGIREIEFYAQVHQLIHGGRNPALRQRGTRAALDALATADVIGADEAMLLGDSYDRLRQIEHRLQMVADRQTHVLPPDPAALDGVARLDALPDGAALIAEVRAITDAVGARYDALIARSPGAAGPSAAGPSAPGPGAGGAPLRGAALRDQLADLGFADTDALAARIGGWREGRLKALRSEAARAALDAIQPRLLAAFAASPEPLRAIVRWEQLLAGLPSAINLFHLLEARPALLDLLARVLALAPPLADALARRADLLDPLIDPRALALPGDIAALIADFASAGETYETRLDAVRRKVGEWRFTLGVRLIADADAKPTPGPSHKPEGRKRSDASTSSLPQLGGAGGGHRGTDPLDVSYALGRVAEAAIGTLADAAIAEFRHAHGVVPESELAILGLGRIGGGALTHASDLDLVFVFTGDFRAESDGRRPLGGTLYYNRLAQRIIAALSVATAEGALYDVDTRLRPSGDQGPLAVSLDSFARYQREQAWTWEHMALCRARPLYGSDPARAALAAIVRGVLETPRDPAALRGDVLAMRERMARHKPARGALDVKLLRGGLVDLEFIVHFLQLRDHVALTPDIGEAVRGLAQGQRIVPALIDAHDVMTRTLIVARLLAPDGAAPPAPARPILAAAVAGAHSDWDDLSARLARARGSVAQAWLATFGERLEID